MKFSENGRKTLRFTDQPRSIEEVQLRVIQKFFDILIKHDDYINMEWVTNALFQQAKREFGKVPEHYRMVDDFRELDRYTMTASEPFRY